MKCFMRFLLILFGSVVASSCCITCLGQQSDTLLVRKQVSLLLSNGFAVPAFSVTGDIYLTKDVFVLHPTPYFGRRYEMYNDLVKDVVLPYQSILEAKKMSRILGGLQIRTKSTVYKIEMTRSARKTGGKNLKYIIERTNPLRAASK